VREAVEQDPDLSTDNPMFTQVMQPGMGSFPVPSHPATFSAAERIAPKAAPTLGMHTEEILSDVAGLCDTEVAQLFDAGVVQSPDYAVARSAA